MSYSKTKAKKRKNKLVDLEDTRKGYVALATYGSVALILRTNRVIECDVKC